MTASNSTPPLTPSPSSAPTPRADPAPLSTPTPATLRSPPSSISKKIKGGRRVGNPNLTDEQRRRERVLKNRESAMKSLQKKKRYTEDLEHRAVALATRNQELRERIRVLLGRLQQMGIVAVPGVGVFSPSALPTPYSSIQPTATPVPPPTASAPILTQDWPVYLNTQPSVPAQPLQLPESLPAAAPVATTATDTTAPAPAVTATAVPATAAPATLPQQNDESAAMPNQSLPLMETPPQSPSLPWQPDPFSLSDSEPKLGVFDIPHMTCQ